MANTVEYIYEVLDRFSGPLKKFDRMVATNKEHVEKFSRSGKLVGASIGGVVSNVAALAAKASIVTALTGGGLFAIVKKVAYAAGDLNDTAAMIGIAVEGYQRLGYAAKIAGSSQEELGQGLKLFNRTIGAAATGNKTVSKEFARVGISIRDAKKHIKPTEQLFGELADKIANMPDGAAKTALAMKFFGKSGANLIPTLNLGSAGLKKMADEADRLGIVMSRSMVDAGDDASDNMDRLGLSFEGLGNSIAGALLPIMSSLSVSLTDIVVANREVIATTIKGYVETSIQALKKLHKMLKPVIAAFSLLADVIGPANLLLLIFGVTVGGPLLLSIVNLTVGLYGLSSAMVLIGANLARLAFTSFLSAIGSMIVAVQTAGGVFAAFNAVLMANPIGATIIAVTALAAAGYLIYENWGAISAASDKLWSGMVDWIKIVLDKISPLIEAFKLVFKYSPVGLAISAGSAIASYVSDSKDAPATPPPAVSPGKAATNVAERRETQNNVNVSGAIDVRGKDGAKVERAKIGLNGGSNLATAQ